MEGQKEQALIRPLAFYVASDQSLDFLSHDYEHLKKTLSPIKDNLKTIYEYKHMEKTDLGKHCLLPISQVFPDDVLYVREHR